MPDRKTIMSWLEGLTQDDWQSFHSDSEVQQIAMATLELLKEQEAELSFREAKAITHTATKLDDATCPSCGNVVGEKQTWEGRKIFIQWKYCIFCGQKLDWKSR